MWRPRLVSVSTAMAFAALGRSPARAPRPAARTPSLCSRDCRQMATAPGAMRPSPANRSRAALAGRTQYQRLRALAPMDMAPAGIKPMHSLTKQPTLPTLAASIPYRVSQGSVSMDMALAVTAPLPARRTPHPSRALSVALSDGLAVLHWRPWRISSRAGWHHQAEGPTASLPVAGLGARACHER